jgi:hypothetical protein
MREEITNCSLSAIAVSGDGAIVRFIITDTAMPHDIIHIECEDVVVFQIHRTPGDELPYFLGEAVWTHLSEAETASKLSDIGYSFSGDDGQPLQPASGKLYYLRFDGGITGEILCNVIKVIRPVKVE